MSLLWDMSGSRVIGSIRFERGTLPVGTVIVPFKPGVDTPAGYTAVPIPLFISNFTIEDIENAKAHLQKVKDKLKKNEI